jgi:hypothetical protein
MIEARSNPMLTIYVAYALLAVLIAAVAVATVSFLYDAIQKKRAREKAAAWWSEIQRKQKLAGRK